MSTYSPINRSTMSLYSFQVSKCVFYFPINSLNNGLCPFFKIRKCLSIFYNCSTMVLCLLKFRIFLFSINRSTMTLSFFKSRNVFYFPIKLLNNEAQSFFFSVECLYFLVINNEAHCLF
jgi:hypothetical protein